MREMATFLGVLMLLPGACSLLVMMGLGPSNSLSLMASVHYGDTDIRHLGRNENAIA